MPITLANVRCVGTEANILDCGYSEPTSCDHSLDAGVRCMARSGE